MIGRAHMRHSVIARVRMYVNVLCMFFFSLFILFSISPSLSSLLLPSALFCKYSMKFNVMSLCCLFTHMATTADYYIIDCIVDVYTSTGNTRHTNNNSYSSKGSRCTPFLKRLISQNICFIVRIFFTTSQASQLCAFLFTMSFWYHSYEFAAFFFVSQTFSLFRFVFFADSLSSDILNLSAKNMKRIRPSLINITVMCIFLNNVTINRNGQYTGLFHSLMVWVKRSYNYWNSVSRKRVHLLIWIDTPTSLIQLFHLNCSVNRLIGVATKVFIVCFTIPC